MMKRIYNRETKQLRKLPSWVNKEYLYKEYILNKKSAKSIAISVGMKSENSVLAALKKFNIPTRSCSEAIHLATNKNKCLLDKNILEFIYGELLGDGCIISVSKHSGTFKYGSCKKDYIQWLSGTLAAKGILQSGEIGVMYRKAPHAKSIPKGMFTYQSLCYRELRPIRLKFYPNGKKIVPEDIELSPIMLRQWYIGDGSLIHKKGNKHPYIVLSTNGFTNDDVDILISKLKKLTLKVTKGKAAGNEYIIRVSAKSSRQFLDYIGPCPEEIKNCYGYKWVY